MATTDIATLGFEVDTSGLVRGAEALDRMGQAQQRQRILLERGTAAAEEYDKQLADTAAAQRLLAERAQRTTEAERQLEQQTREAADAQEELEKQAREAADGLDESAQAAGGFAGFLGKLNPVAAAVGAALAAIPLAEVAGYMLDSYRSTEKFTGMLKTSFLGDVGAASAQMKRLLEYSATTPYTMDQAVEGFVMLKNLGLDPSIEAMRSYGNTATAMGKEFTQMIEAVADASRGEFERLQEFGIAAETNGDKVKMTFQGVTTEISKDSKSIQAYLQSIGNVNFATAMQDQMSTLDGFIANLTDSAAALSATFIEQSGAASTLKSMLSSLAAVMVDVNEAMLSEAKTPRAMLQDTWDGDSTAAIAQMKALTEEFKTASQERRVEIRNEMMDFYGMLTDKQAEYVAAIQSVSAYTDIPGLGIYAEKLAAADGQRVAATESAIHALKEAFKQTGTEVEAIDAKQVPFWERMEQGAKKAAAAVAAVGSSYTEGKAKWLPQDVRYGDEISKYSQEFNVDPRLVQAVIQQESQGKSTAVSPKGAGGLMQLMPPTAAAVAKDLDMTGYSMFNAADNIRLGVAYLSQQLVKYDGNVEKALAAYNAGPGAVDKYGGVPPYKETQNYVKKITANYAELTGEAQKGRDTQEREAKQAATQREREAKQSADKQAREAKQLADSQERDAKRLADFKAAEAEKLVDAERKAAEENFQLSMERAIELVKMKAQAATVGMSKIDAYGAGLRQEGYSPEEIASRVDLKRNTAFDEMSLQIQDIYRQAVMTTEQFQQWTLVHKEGLTPAMAETIAAMEREAQQAAEVRGLFESWGDVINGNLSDSLKQLVSTGDELLDSLIAKLIEAIVTSQTLESTLNSSGTGKGLGGTIMSGIGSLFGFATGGSFTVGGGGGTDSQVVAFRASPGERVSVATPAQQERGMPAPALIQLTQPNQSRSGGVSIVVTNNGSPVKATASAQDRDGKLQIEVILDQLEARQASGIRSGGSPVDSAIQDVYGLRRTNY